MLAKTATPDGKEYLGGPLVNDDSVWVHELGHYGDWAVISSTDRDSADPGSSIVSIYQRDGSGTWGYVQGLQHCYTAIGFGSDVAISGEWIVVGAWKQGDPCLPGADGAVFVQELQPADPGQSFGWSVDIWGDTLAVGAPFDRPTSNGPGGSVYFFQRSGTQFQEVFSSPNPEAAGYHPTDAFGSDVVVAQNTILVSNPGFRSEVGVDYEFQRTPFQGWELVGEKFQFPYQAGQRYGSAIAATPSMMIAAAEGWDRYDCDGVLQAADCGAVFPSSLLGLTQTLTMTANRISISAAVPQPVEVTIDFGLGAAGQTFQIVGNITDPSPGMDIFGISGPAADSMPHVAFRTVHTPDLYFQFTTGSGWTPLSERSGQLDEHGQATVTFNWPPGLYASSAMLPLEVTHTAILVGDLHYETTPAQFTIEP